MNELDSPTLSAFVAAGVLEEGHALIARRLGRLAGEGDERVLLACALALRAVALGSVCVELSSVAGSVFDRNEEHVVAADLPWPEPAAWLEALSASALVTCGAEAPGVRPMRLVGGLAYLERYWAHQESVRTLLQGRRDEVTAPPDPVSARAMLGLLFPGDGLAAEEPDHQRLAAATALCTRLMILAGGPGTGKTTTVARTLALMLQQWGPDTRVTLSAPTGKAARRLQESLQSQLPGLEAILGREVIQPLREVEASTVHRLLGWRPDSRSRFRHDARHPLPFDVVVVDEASMLSLALTARLLEALSPAARLLLVGDPDQLASVDAGAVLADVTHATAPPLPALTAAVSSLSSAGAPEPGVGSSIRPDPSPEQGTFNVVELVHTWRFDAGIQALSDAIRRGDARGALATLREGRDDVRFVEVDLTAPGDPPVADLITLVRDSAAAIRAAAELGDAAGALRALDGHRLLCAHRTGPCGVARWSHLAERWAVAGAPPPTGAWYAGLPLLVNQNLREIDLYNGDAGVVVAAHEGLRLAFPAASGTRLLSSAQVENLSPLYAMTVHKAQGSQFGQVSLILPPPGSPLLTRELLYTAVTRAKNRVTVYGLPEAVQAAVTTRALRASGLRERLSRA